MPPPPPPPEEEDGPAASSSDKNPKRPKKCWLCTFANCKLAKQISVFAASNAGTMDPAIMSEQIQREVLKEYPRARGIGRRHVMCHIREHMLIPGIRLAGIVRSLITLAETLRCTLQQVDEDTGDLVVDIRNTELYLKVITQITNVYKLDSSKLLFQNGLAPSLTGIQQQQQHATLMPNSRKNGCINGKASATAASGN